jgi:hypothetical protein
VSAAPRVAPSSTRARRRARAMTLRGCLRGALKFTNALLLVLGVFAALFALHLLLTFQKERGSDGGGGGSGAGPPPSAAAPPSPPGSEVTADEPWCARARALSLASAAIARRGAPRAATTSPRRFSQRQLAAALLFSHSAPR